MQIPSKSLHHFGRWLRFLPCLGFLLFAVPASADIGIVSHRIHGCEWFLVESESGFVLMEWYGGNDPDRDDEIVGEIEIFGFQDLFNNTADEELQVYIDDYMLSKTSALEKLYEECE